MYSFNNDSWFTTPRTKRGYKYKVKKEKCFLIARAQPSKGWTPSKRQLIKSNIIKQKTKTKLCDD